MFKVLDFAFPQSKEIAGIASTQSLEKEKTCCEAKEFKTLLTRKVFAPFFTQSLASVFSELNKEKGEKLVSKIHDKVEQEIQQRD